MPLVCEDRWHFFVSIHGFANRGRKAPLHGCKTMQKNKNNSASYIFFVIHSCQSEKSFLFLPCTT